MYRATTPTHTYKLPIQTSECRIIKVIYKQGAATLSKCYRDSTVPDGMTLDGNKVIIKLTQQETLMFNAKDPVRSQVRVLTEDGDVLASRRFKITVNETQDEEILT